MEAVMRKSVIVKSPTAPFLKTPSFDSAMVDEGLYGQKLQVIKEEEGGWLYVSTAYDYEGWVHEDHVIASVETQSEQYHMTWVASDVMSEPKYASKILVTLPRGAIVGHTGIFEDKWEMIELVDGKLGWIRKGFSRQVPFSEADLLERPQKLRHALVVSAMSYMGTQYRWGGKSSFGIDCSGLVSMAYSLNGITIKRDADQQEATFKHIHRNLAQAGDLYFFPGHVAMALGDGRYVHSTGREGYVLINSLNPADADYREDLDLQMTATGTLF